MKEPSVQLRLKIRNPDSHQVEPVSFTLTADKFRVFLNGRSAADLGGLRSLKTHPRPPVSAANITVKDNTYRLTSELPSM